MTNDEDTSMVKICENCGALEYEKIENPADKIVEHDGIWLCKDCLAKEGVNED